MTLEELQSLTDRELDTVVYETIMGGSPMGCFVTDSGKYFHIGGAPAFSTDLNLAAQVEEKVIEKVGWFDFTNVLMDVLKLANSHDFVHEDVYGASRATARQRVIACLMAWQGAMDLAQALNDTVTQYDDALRNLGEGLQGDAE
jgi:hypothetical protein